jgi:protein-S-isoprenylcysteine O-methyltransferase Ste14
MAGAADLVPPGEAAQAASTGLVRFGEAARAAPSGLVPSGAAAPAAAPSRWLRLKPPRIALVLSILALALHALVQGGAVPWAQSRGGGALLMLAGFGWMAWAWFEFRAADTPLPPTARPAVLVDHGPFRFGRNPMYLGMTAMMLGLGLASGVPLMAVAALNFVVIVNAVHIAHEEANMQRAFGGWYSDYAASVRRWL